MSEASPPNWILYSSGGRASSVADPLVSLLDQRILPGRPEMTRPIAALVFAWNSPHSVRKAEIQMALASVRNLTMD